MICHVFKRGRLYWGKLQLDSDPRLSRVSLGTTDKRVAQSKLWEIAKEREMEAMGMLPPQSAREAAKRPLSELLTAFLDDLQAKGRAATTVVKYRVILTKLFERCHWRILADVTARSFCEWRARCELSAKTLNDLLAAMASFFHWMEHQRYTVESPLKHVQRIDTRGRGQQYRRALTADELKKLLGAAPPHRRIVYLTAVFTGLRRTEMKLLRWSDVELDGASQFIRVRASTTKNRKSAVLPLHPELAAALREFRPVDAAPFASVFAQNLPRISTFRRDLVNANVPFLDDLCRRVDLHSLRMTYGTNLTLAGASPRVVQELMRHSDMKLTMKIYTDAGQLPLSDAVNRLPGLKPQILGDAPINVLSG